MQISNIRSFGKNTNLTCEGSCHFHFGIVLALLVLTARHSSPLKGDYMSVVLTPCSATPRVQNKIKNKQKAEEEKTQLTQVKIRFLPPITKVDTLITFQILGFRKRLSLRHFTWQTCATSNIANGSNSICTPGLWCRACSNTMVSEFCSVL